MNRLSARLIAIGMTACGLVCAAAFADGDAASALIAKLGAAKYADREAAAKELEKLGPVALPALKKYLDAPDPEIRSRAATILAKIETNELAKPTLYQLDFHDRPIASVVDELNRRGPIKLMLFPVELDQWKTKRITLVAPAPVPFWKAIDELCAAAGLQANTGSMGISQDQEPLIQLIPGANQISPACYHGPTRVRLTSVHRHQDYQIGVSKRGIEKTQASDQFYAIVEIAAEPRLRMSRGGEPSILEAIDDKGRSLVPDRAGANVARPAMMMQNMMMQTSMMRPGAISFGPGQQAYQTALAYPEGGARSIKTLKGTIPIIIAARRSDPVLIDLKESIGKKITIESVIVTIHEVQTLDDKKTTIDVSFEATGEPQDDIDAAPGSLNGFLIQDLQNQLEIDDQNGKPLRWHIQSTNFINNSARMTIVIDPRMNMMFNAGIPNAVAPGPLGGLILKKNAVKLIPPKAEAQQPKGEGQAKAEAAAEANAPPQSRTATKIRFFKTARVKLEVPFEFHDIPTP
jgi:hypothetical protein